MSETETKKGKFPVIEIFGPTIQGEGLLAGQRTHFVRFGGCPYRCKWCDTMYAVDPEQVKANATWMSPAEIIRELQDLKPSKWVSLSGGDPVMWDLTPLMQELTFRWHTLVETEGALWRNWLMSCDVLTVSPKPPSSGMADKLDHSILAEYASSVFPTKVMKIVVFDEEDFKFARELHKQYTGFKFFLTPGTPQYISMEETTKLHIMETQRWLSDKVLECDDLQDAIIIPQLHVLTWGTKRGV